MPGAWVSVSHANYIWETRQQVTNHDVGEIIKQIEFGKDPEAAGHPFIHAVTRAWYDAEYPNGGTGYYLAVDSANGDALWTSATRTRFTRFGAPQEGQEPLHNADFNFVVDEDDFLHVVFEADRYEETDYHRTTGYKTNADSELWDADEAPIFWGPSAPCIANSPNVAVEVVGSDAYLHAVCRAEASCSVPGALYNRLDLSDDPQEWQGLALAESTAYSSGLTGHVVVDGNGIVHVFAREAFCAGEDQQVRMVQFAGYSPEPGEWTVAHRETLDTFDDPDNCPCDTPPTDPDCTPPAQPSGDGGDAPGLTAPGAIVGNKIYFAWRRYDSTAEEHVIAFGVLDVSASEPANWVWTPPLPLGGEE